MNSKEYYQANKEKIKAHVKARYDKLRIENPGFDSDYSKKWRSKSEKNKQIYRDAQKKWRQNNREKVRAYKTVEYALKTGKLTKQPCEVCGSVDVHAHHSDYSKPLEVHWYCPRCHKSIHR